MSTAGDTESRKMDSSTSDNSAWLIAGFLCLGGSVGLISGLSNAAVTLPLIAALLALFGGGIIPLLAKVASADREVFGKLLCAFAISFSIFITAGLVVKVNGLFIFRTWTQDKSIGEKGDNTSNMNAAGNENLALLKSDRTTFDAKIESLCRNGDYVGLHSALQEGK